MLATPMNKYRDQMVESLCSLVSKKSVKGEPSLNMPYGKGVFSALINILDLAERLDLDSINLFGHMGCVSYGKGEETLAVLTHLDVVPAGEGWDTDPFTAVVKDGRIYGRGTVDNKGAAIAALYALYALKENCVTLNKKVILLFGCDEETEWNDIAFYKENYPDPDYVISPDASFPIINSEKGLLQMRLEMSVGEQGIIRSICSGDRVNVVPAKASAELNADESTARAICGCAKKADIVYSFENGICRLQSEGISSHGSAPEKGVNALTELISAICRCADTSEGSIEKFISCLDELIGFDIYGERLGIAQSDEISGKLTVNVGNISVRDGAAVSELDIRLPLSSDIDEVEKRLTELFEKRGIKAVTVQKKAPHHVDEASPLVTSLKKAYLECFGEEADCRCSAGATYARAFKNGVAFGPVPKDKDECIHSPNECIEISDMVKLANVLACAITEIAGDPGANLLL